MKRVFGIAVLLVLCLSLAACELLPVAGTNAPDTKQETAQTNEKTDISADKPATPAQPEAEEDAKPETPAPGEEKPEEKAEEQPAEEQQPETVEPEDPAVPSADTGFVENPEPDMNV